MNRASIFISLHRLLLEALLVVPCLVMKPGTRAPSQTIHSSQRLHLSSNGDLNLNTGLDVDDDLLDNLGRGVKAVKEHSC